MNNNSDNDPAISINKLSKKFKLYASNIDRIKEFLHPARVKYYQEYSVLNQISFDIKKGEAVAILGRNGSGKSTLLQIIASVMHPTSGSVYIDGKVSALLELGAGFNPLFTGRENAILNGVIQGVSEKDMIERLPNIESFADIGEYFYQPVGTYSSGMFIRLAFASSISLDPDIILVDEALAVGDAKFQHKCFNKFQEYLKQGKTIVVVSHDTETLLRFCDSGIVLDENRILYKGDIASAVSMYHSVLYKKIKINSNDQYDDINNNISYVENSISSDRCKDNPNYNHDEIRIGDKRGIIVDYCVVSNGKENPSKINYGEEFKISMTVFFHEDIENVHFGFAIVTKDSVHVHGTNTQMQHVMPLNVKENEIVIMEFSAQALFASNDYFINLGIYSSADENIEYIDNRRSIGHIIFSGADWCNGFIAFPPSIKLQKRKFIPVIE